MVDANPYEPPQVPVAAVGESPTPRKPWGFWATLGWAALAAVVWLAMQTGIGIVFFIVSMVRDSQQDAEAVGESLQHNGLLLALATLLANPVAIGVCGLAIWVRGIPLRDYFALTRFSRRDLLLGLGCLALFIPLSDGLMLLTDRPVVPEFMEDAWHTAGFLPLLFLALVVGAPLGEELFFRGFLFRGWSASRIGPVGATLLTSVLWSVIHLQYDWFQISHIVASGLLLGWLRWRSGSVWLTILLHALMNLVATIEAAVKIELLS